MSGIYQEAETITEADEAVEHAKRKSRKPDDRSLREARAGIRIGTPSWLNFSNWDWKASRQSPSKKRPISRSDKDEASASISPSLKKKIDDTVRDLHTSPNEATSNHIKSLDEAVRENSGSTIDEVQALDFTPTDKTNDELYPEHIDKILHGTFYRGAYLPCQCDEHRDPRYICPLDKYQCALRLDCRHLTLHGDHMEYFFDTVFAEKDKEKPNWKIVRFQISKKGECSTSEVESADVGSVAASSQQLQDFCSLLEEPLGPVCIPLRFRGTESKHDVLRLNVIQPGIAPECGTSIPLQKILEEGQLPTAHRLILAYLVARSIWQYYMSDWVITTNWNLGTILFLPEKHVDLAFNPSVPFLDLRKPDSLPAAPKEYTDDLCYTHQYPRILILGLLLFQICSKSPRKTNISDGFSPLSVNSDCSEFIMSQQNGAWPALDLDSYHVNLYMNIVAECFPTAGTSNFKGTLLDSKLGAQQRRALLKERIVIPLYKLLKGMGLLDQYDNIRPVLSVHEDLSIDEIGVVDPKAEKWLDKITQSTLACHVGNKFNAGKSNAYNPRVPVNPRPRVAILDTGYDPESVFLGHGHKKRLDGHWKDFCKGLLHPRDDDGHGTSMLDLVLRIAPFADVYVARIAGGATDLIKESKETSRRVAEAIVWAACKQGVDAILMSFGWDKEIMVDGMPLVSNAISDALSSRNQKVLFFAAASNSGGGAEEMFPAANKNVFSIHGTDTNGHDPGFNASPRAPHVLGTLGCRVPTAQRGRNPIPIGRTGTSVAAAITVGIVALVLGYINTSERKTRWGKLRTYEHMHSLLLEFSTSPSEKRKFITSSKIFSCSTSGFDSLLDCRSERYT